MALPEMVFDAEEIRLKRIVDHTALLGYEEAGFVCGKIDQVYGPLAFRKKPEGRPLVYASYVMSVDGKIAFMDNEVGPLIAQNNYLDPNGALADFWILNMLRGQSDGIIIGSGTLIKEPNYSGSAYDRDILDARRAAGKPLAPWTVIVTRSGQNIPFHNPVFQCEEVPFLIATSPVGYQSLIKDLPKDHVLLPVCQNEDDQETIRRVIRNCPDKIAVFVSGNEDEPDSSALMKVLDAMGMEKVLVESPAYCHHLMQKKLLHEIFINTSCVFVGGQATGIGSSETPFLSTDHPHCDIVSIHLHQTNFLYTRYCFRYDVMP